MKTTKNILAIFAIVAMMSVSCTAWVEDTLIPVFDFNGSISQFSSDLYEIDETRAGIHDDDALNANSSSVKSFRSVWHEGDNLTILKFNAGQTTPQIVSGTAVAFRNNRASAVFGVEPKIHTDGEQYALYPKQANADVKNYTSGSVGKREFKITLPEQTLIDAEPGDCPFRYPLLLGHWKPNSDTSLSTFRFSNPFAVLRLQLRNDEDVAIRLNHINVKGNNGELMWGSAIAKFVDTNTVDSEGNPVYEKSVTMAAGAETFLNLDCRVDGENGYELAPGEVGEFYVCIPAQNYKKGFTVTFFCDNNYYMEQPLMSKNGVDCTNQKNTVVVLPTLGLDLEKSSIFTTCLRSTVSTLAVAWSTNAANSAYLSELIPSNKANYKSEKKNVYLLELWSAWDYNSKVANGGNGAANGSTTSPANLVSTWLIKDNVCYKTQGDQSSGVSIFTDQTRPQRFVFTGLNPGTDYYFRVKYMASSKWDDTESANASYMDSANWTALDHPRKLRTLDSPATDAKTILFEDFSECVLCGDYSTRSAGYSSYTRAKAADYKAVTMNAYGTPYANDVNNLIMPNRAGLLSEHYGDGSDWYVCYSGLETGLFDTVQQIVFGSKADASKKSPALKDWAWYNEGLVSNAVFMRAGYVKVGGHYKHTKMITPQLNATGTAASALGFTGPATVEVEFWACPYGADEMDDGERPIAVEVLDGGTFTYDNTTTNYSDRAKIKNTLNTLDGFTVSDRVELSLEGNQYTWNKYVVRLNGVLPTSRIAFSANRPEPDTNNRFLLDDVCIRLVENTPLAAKLIRATDSTLAFAWSSNTANIPTMASALPNPNLNFETEISDTYAVAIYDANKNLLGKLNKVVKDDSSAALYSKDNKPMRWIFTGLTPSTKYYLKVWNTTKGTESNYLEASTIAPAAVREDVVPLTETAVAGQMLLFENFEKCLYGGDHSTRSAGYKHKNSSTGIYSLSKAGEQTHTSGAYFAQGCAANQMLFTTLKNMVGNLGLTGWSWVDNDTRTNTATATISVRPGYIQIGTQSARNWFITPSLTNMPKGKSSIRVSFKACPYGKASKALDSSEKKERDIAVRVLTGGSVGSDYQLTGYTVADIKSYTLSGESNTVWDDVVMQFDYVPQGARIAFGDGRTDDLGAYNRWQLDDVKIELLSNAEIAVGVVRATDTTINIGWTVTESNKSVNYLELNPMLNATSYDFKTTDIRHKYKIYLYRDEACTDLYLATSFDPYQSTTDSSGKETVSSYGHFAIESSSSASICFPTRFTFGGLEPSTTYYVKVADTTAGITSSSIAVSTIAKAYEGKACVTDPTELSYGNTMLFENFGDFYYNGDTAGYAAGYHRSDTATELYKAEGDNPYAATEKYDFARSTADKEAGLFSTLGGIVDDLGMTDWRYWSDDGACRVLMKPGYAKIGNGSNKAGLVTPVLTMIPGGKTVNVKVRFKAAAFTETTGTNKAEENAIIVEAIDDASCTTFEATEEAPYLAYRIVRGHVIASVPVTLTDPGHWKEYEVTLQHVTNGCRISIGGNRSTAGQNRFYIDDIQVIFDSADTSLYLYGKVYEADKSTPVAGVVMTDGYHVTQTDESGSYKLPYEPEIYNPEFVYYTTPAGYEIGRAGTGLPHTYYKVGDTNLKPAEGDYAKDFYLGEKMTAETHERYNEATGKQDSWFLFVMADPQTHDSSKDKCFERFSKYVAPDIKARVSGFNSAIASSSGTAQGYGVVLGDITWNAPDAHKNTMKKAMEVSDTGIYWYTAPGNHDWYQSDSDTSPNISAFKETFGPTRISFDRGDMHVVVMNNVIVKDASGKSLSVENYEAGFTDEDYTWLHNDLSYVDKNKGVVLCVHIPFRGGSTSGGANQNKEKHYDDVLTELSQFQHAYIFSGHTHKQEMYVHTKYPTAAGDYVTEVVHASAAGSLWNTSICADGTPAGYTIYTFNGPRVSWQRFKAIGNTKAISGNWKNNIRMYWAYELGKSATVMPNNGYYYNRGTGHQKYIIANVFCSHNDGGKAGELSGDWVVQLYDPQLKKWVDMKRLVKDDGSWRTWPTTFNAVSASSFEAKNDSGTSYLRNDVDWWWWSNVVESNSYITNRNGNNWGGASDSSGYQASSTHIWRGALSYTTLTESDVKGTKHGIKVRAIPPQYANTKAVQDAITNGTDLASSYDQIYICDTFTHYGQSDSDYYGLDWTTVTGSNTIYKK